MILPSEYSKQESTLKPADITEEYVRLQVRLHPENNKVIISCPSKEGSLKVLSTKGI